MIAELAYYSFLSRATLLRIIMAQKIQLAELRRSAKRIHPTPRGKAMLVFFLKGVKAWKHHLYIVRPATFRKWTQTGVLRLWNVKNRCKDWWRRMNGRARRRGPRYKYADLIHAITTIVNNNPEYGIDKIHGKLRSLDYHLARSRLAEILRKKFPDRGPWRRRTGRGDTWKQIFCGLTPGLWAMDFFVQLDCLVRPQYCFVLEDLARRRVLHFAATYHPTGVWVTQQIRTAITKHGAPNRLLSDNDKIFSSAALARLLKKHNIDHARTTPRSPWQNGVVERLIGTLRREVFNRVLIFSSAQSERIMDEYIPYYNARRSHLTLELDSPDGRPIQPRPAPNARLEAIPVLNGLEHDYVWQDKAA